MAKRTQKKQEQPLDSVLDTVFRQEETLHQRWQKRVRNTLALSVNIKKFPESLWEFGIAVNVTTLSLVVRGSHSQEHLTQTVELCVESVEGATTADMAFIAQQAALDYERSLTETEEE